MGHIRPVTSEMNAWKKRKTQALILRRALSVLVGFPLSAQIQHAPKQRLSDINLSNLRLNRF